MNNRQVEPVDKTINKVKRQTMRNRMDRAAKEYERRFDGTAKGRFYASDLYEIVALTEGQGIYDSLYFALKAAFMIGYRCKAAEVYDKLSEVESSLCKLTERSDG